MKIKLSAIKDRHTDNLYFIRCIQMYESHHRYNDTLEEVAQALNTTPQILEEISLQYNGFKPEETFTTYYFKKFSQARAVINSYLIMNKLMGDNIE